MATGGSWHISDDDVVWIMFGVIFAVIIMVACCVASCAPKRSPNEVQDVNEVQAANEVQDVNESTATAASEKEKSQEISLDMVE